MACHADTLPARIHRIEVVVPAALGGCLHYYESKPFVRALDIVELGCPDPLEKPHGAFPEGRLPEWAEAKAGGDCEGGYVERIDHAHDPVRYALRVEPAKRGLHGFACHALARQIPVDLPHGLRCGVEIRAMSAAHMGETHLANDSSRGQFLNHEGPETEDGPVADETQKPRESEFGIERRY